MKLAVSSWSLRDHVNIDFTLAEMPTIVKSEYGISAIELCSRHFLNTDSKYLDGILKGLEEADSKLINIPIDTGNISQDDDRKRLFDIKIICTWIEIASYLNCPQVRVNTGDNSKGDINITIDSYKRIVDFAERKNVGVLLENHGGISSDPDNIIAICRAIQSDHFGLCPDFGNFDSNNRYIGIEKMMPFAKLVHAKTHILNHKGMEFRFDFARCLKIAKDSGYDGYLSAETHGRGNQWDALTGTISLIQDNW